MAATIVSGRDLRRLMRINKITIRNLSAATGFTLKRIRLVLKHGLCDTAAARDWIQAITGRDPGPMADQPLDQPGYAVRVAVLESEGLTTSDAQSVADAELMRKAGAA